jgi:hypothetical protein
VNDTRRHDQQRWSAELVRDAFRAHLAAAIENDEQLMQVPMRMRADLPVIEPAAIGDRFDVDESLFGDPGWLAI